MSKWALIPGALIIGGLGFFALNDANSPAPGAAKSDPVQPEPQTTAIKHHAFLDDIDLGETGNGYAVLLHPMATGGDPRAVVDVAALKRAQGKAFYMDATGEQLKTTLMSTAFLSPAGNPPNSRFVSILRNKKVEAEFICYPAYCNGVLKTHAPHTRDLAGLLEASVPVEHVTESYLRPDKVHAAHYRAMQNPEVVQIDPPDLPPLNKFVFPHRMILHLPAVLLEANESGTKPLVPFDEADYLARFTAAFQHAYPMIEAYRLKDLNLTTYYPPEDGWPVVSAEFKGHLRDSEGQIKGINRIMVIEPSIAIELTYGIYSDLQGDDPFTLMPEFAAEPVGLSERLSRLAETELDRPCPDCFKIELPVATVDQIKVVTVDPVSFSLSYIRIKTP